MAKASTRVISLAELLTAPAPKQLVEDTLIKILKKQLTKLRVIWNQEVFRAGLRNPKLPKRLLNKLENLLEVAEASGWDLSTALIHELDETVEDIESFNPAFRKRLKEEAHQARREVKEGNVTSLETLLARSRKT